MPDEISIIKLIERNKQIILYGPPGTGKTYITKELAVDIINKEIKETLGPNSKAVNTVEKIGGGMDSGQSVMRMCKIKGNITNESPTQIDIEITDQLISIDNNTTNGNKKEIELLLNGTMYAAEMTLTQHSITIFYPPLSSGIWPAIGNVLEFGVFGKIEKDNKINAGIVYYPWNNVSNPQKLVDWYCSH